jgi:hypothetical protein
MQLIARHHNIEKGVRSDVYRMPEVEQFHVNVFDTWNRKYSEEGFLYNSLDKALSKSHNLIRDDWWYS